MKIVKEANVMDAIAEDDDKVEVEVLAEFGNPDKLKLYVHVNGETILRICKLNPDNLFMRP